MQKRDRHKKRLWRIVGILCLCGILTVAGIDLYVTGTTKDRIYTSDTLPTGGDYDCILVLGAGVKPDGSPSDMLYDRVATGLRLYKNGHAPILLMSGDDSGPDYDEVGCMLALALAAEVPETDVWLDHEGFSTSESLHRAKTEFGAQRILIVTQSYHLHRALYIADRSGIEATGVSADLRPYRGQLWRDAREVAARVKDFLFAIE